ncbi:dentin sialophosphoprotein [Phlebotomus papatasi]|uniref:dentin sialophosphoprotein n=1 Tax=Phlebotomus papatasi TaxID=29031 RepID=UPI00248392DB|nr:dentin sialophosphoprotein [Phlebotomus papatasi]
MMIHRNRHRSNCDPLWISLLVIVHLMAVLVSGATIKREITANASSPETTSQSPQSTSTETTMVTNAVSPENKTDTQTSKVDAPESGVEVEKVKIVNGSATEELPNESDKPFAFDLSRYTSPYGENAISPAKIDTAEKPESDKSERLEDVEEKDYEKMFEEMVLTTPSSPEFDELHKIYRSDKVPDGLDRENRKDRDGSEEESVAGTTESNYLANLVLSATEASNNETSEKNSSLYYNNGEIETKNYDITTNELKKTNENVTNESGEKRAKYLRPTNQHRAAIISAEGHDVVPTEESDMNLNIPNTAEVWALAGMKSVEHMKSKFNQFANKTSENLSDGNGVNTTSATKLLADWTEIMKNNEFSNSSVSSGDMEEKTMSNKSETTPEQMMGENNVISVLMTTKQPEDTATEIPENTVSRATTDGQEMISVEATKESPSETMGDLEKSRRILNYDLVDSQEDNVNSSEKSESVQFTTDSAIETSTQNIPSTVAESEDSATTTALYTDDGSTDVEYVTNHITNPMTTISSSSTIDDGEGSTTSSEPTASAEISSEDLKTTTKAAQLINEDTTISNAIPTLSPTVTEQSDINQSTTTEDTSDISDNAAKTDRVNETKVENVMTTDKGIETTESSTELSDQLKSTEDLNEVKYLPFPTSHRNLGNFSDEPLLFDSTASSDEQKLTTIAPPQDLDGGQTMPEEGTDVNTIIAATVSVIVVIGVVAIVGFLYMLRKRQKQLTYGQRCRPVGLDAYSLDNVSVYNSVRRKGNNLRLSKRSYGNSAFEDPGLRCNLLTILALDTFVQDKDKIYEEFKEIPLVTARVDEVPQGCEDKNRYANVVPLPETRVHLKQLNGDEKTEYINANFVKGPKDQKNYYIACQAPMDNTIIDFWRMIWEQSSRVIIMATDLTENGIEKCAEYLPPSSVLDCNRIFGDFHVTLKNREVKDKYAVSTIHLKNSSTKTWREIMHFWYQWPESGMPTDESSVIAMLLEARTSLKTPLPEQSEDIPSDTIEETKSNGTNAEVADKSKSLQRTQGPLTVHCSPGTGRTGTLIACDIALRTLEAPARSVDLPQIVYYVRRGRASAIRTQDQYEFIYRVANAYATKLTSPAQEN